MPGRRLPANAERRAFDLAIRPRVPDLGEPRFDLMLAADPIKDVLDGINMPFVIGELDAAAIVARTNGATWRLRQRNVEPVGHGCDQVA